MVNEVPLFSPTQDRQKVVLIISNVLPLKLSPLTGSQKHTIVSKSRFYMKSKPNSFEINVFSINIFSVCLINSIWGHLLVAWLLNTYT